MKTHKFFTLVAFFLAATLSASPVFAQVKIGTNPTVIDATKSLEVEASTTGRKTSINKTTGQVTITDGTEGNGKVLTSDANGNASWQPSYTLILMANNPNTLQPTGYMWSPPIPYVSGDGSTYNATNGEFTAPSDGFYQYNYSLEILGTAGELFTIELSNLDIEDGGIRYSSSTWNPRSVNGIKYLTAGEKISPKIYRGGGFNFTSAWKVRKLSVVVFKL
ncbi:hypothetical protein [Dyadobacter diqingensis]|uniref:hypothetical protein n=1 Tax=Dyadobacter diqingensis TaxID=2938121 RepID=UPI0020C19C9E|nr:hypothetical protein [Dyadobacter diqingensis]